MLISEVAKLSPVDRFTTGIYCILNLKDGKRYVGSAACSVHTRWQVHLHHLRKGNHHSLHLQRAWSRDGAEAFEFILLESCLPEYCIEREQHWIDFYDSSDRRFGYNVYPIASSGPLGVKRPKSVGEAVARANRLRVVSEETRRRMSETRRIIKPRKPKPPPRPHWSKGEFAEAVKLKLSLANRGKTISKRHKAILSKTHKGRKFSEEHKQKIAEALKAYWSRRENSRSS